MRPEHLVAWVCEFCGTYGETLTESVDVLQCDVCGEPVPEVQR